MKEQYKLLILIIIAAIMLSIPSLSNAQNIDTSVEIDMSKNVFRGGEYQIEETYNPNTIELDTLEFHELIVKFKEDYNLSNITLNSWFSSIATATELRNIEFSEKAIERMLKGEYVPFPITQKAIRKHIYQYYTSAP